MREIKFRLFDKKENKLMSAKDMYLSRLAIAPDGYITNIDSHCPETDKVLMQFTGLIDKNGVEIYEGDILYYEKQYKPPFKNGRFEVKWPDASMCEPFYYFSMLGESYEVIGNIYENPELLND